MGIPKVPPIEAILLIYIKLFPPKKMKWINHKIVGASASVAIGLSPVGIAIVTMSTVLPDVVELRFFKHRGWSHAWWVHILLFLTAIVAFPSLLQLISYVALGVLLHLVCDALTMTGVPAYPFSDKRIAAKLFKTGDFIEYVLATFVALIAFLLFLTGDS